MNVFTKLYRGETKVDFVGASKRALIVSAVLVGVSLLAMLVRPFNLSIDFTGGTIISVPNTADASVEEIRSALATVGQEGATVQVTGEGFVLVRTEALDPAEQDALLAAVVDVAGSTLEDANVDAVGPTFGAEVTRRAVEALVIFLIVVTLFITWRFEWKMALAALAALFHDLIVTGGIYAISGFSVTPATIIAILTILGYSLYDTVVVFDKVTENVREHHANHTFSEIANLSMNQVMMRSINTSLTTLLPIGSLLFVGSYLLGAATLREFALALFIGVAVGTYSSVFVATPLLARWKEGEEEWKRVRARLARKRGETDLIAAEETSVVATASEIVTESGAAARPPRQRRKRR